MPFRQGLNSLTRLGSSPKLGFYGIMAGSSCVPAPEKFFVPLLGLIWNLPWELYGPTLVLILEVWTTLEQYVQPGMLDFSPRTVKTVTIAKSCSILGWSQRFAILE